jgi:hypothetical protein
MGVASFDQLFDKALPLANKTTLTVTELPEAAGDLLELLNRAMLHGFVNHANLTEIHLPMERFPFIDAKFWHIPVEDCGDAQVLRFFFEMPEPTH